MRRFPQALLPRRFRNKVTQQSRRDAKPRRSHSSIAPRATLELSSTSHGVVWASKFLLGDIRQVCSSCAAAPAEPTFSGAAAPEKTHIIEGTINRVLYYDGGTGYHALVVKPCKIDGKITREGLKVVGEIAERLQKGEKIKMKTTAEQEHPTHGPQYKYLQRETMDEPSAVEVYLMDTVPGIGKKSASAIQSHFGKRTWDTIEKNPERLTWVKELGEKKAESFVKHLRKRNDDDLVRLFRYLHKHGINLIMCKRILGTFNHGRVYTPESIRKDPYSLLRVRGLRFESVDRIAVDLAGFARDGPERFKVCVDDALLSNSSGNGSNTAFKQNDFLQLMRSDRYGYGLSRISDLIPLMVKEGVIVAVEYQGESYIQHSTHHATETSLAERINSIMKSNSSLPRVDADAKIAGALENSDFNSFSINQRKAITQALSEHKITILTGGPGTGKTAVLGSLVDILDGDGAVITLAAPTGVAAKRLGNSTQKFLTERNASTIHKLLQYDYRTGTSVYNASNKLESDFVIIDEASMVDTNLACALLTALPDSSHLLIVGDNDQLPSIGLGRVLGDLIDSKKVPVTKLTKPYRHSEGSEIALIAHAVNNGDVEKSLPDSMILSGIGDLSTAKEVQFVKASDLELLGTMGGVQSFITEELAIKEITDYQILTPSRKWVKKINDEFQRLNPAFFIRGSKRFKENDKVMQIRNDYDKCVFNGMIGVVECDEEGDRFSMEACSEINEGSEINESAFLDMQVKFENGSSLEYNCLDEEDLELAYASTIHKTQGSDFQAIIIVLPEKVSNMLLTRKLLYTALTRGKKHVIFIGSTESYLEAVKNNCHDERRTLLKEYLENARK